MWTSVYGLLTLVGVFLFFGLPLTLFDEFSNVPTLVAVMVLLVVLIRWEVAVDHPIITRHGRSDAQRCRVDGHCCGRHGGDGFSVMNEAIHIVPKGSHLPP